MNVAVKVTKTKAEQDLSNHFAAVAANLPGGEWVNKMRTDAMAAFEQSGLPHRRVEEWKYTDLRTRLQEAFTPALATKPEITEQQVRSALGALGALDAIYVFIVDATYIGLSPGAETLPEGLEVMPLHEAIKLRPDWFKNQLGQVNQDYADTLAILNTAFMSSGAVIRVNDNIQLEKPIHIVFANSGDERRAINTRNVISVGNGAQTTLLESHIALGDTPGQSNSVTELVVGSHAQTDHVKFQNESIQSAHLSSWLTSLGESANYRAFQFTVGAALARNQLFVRFAGEHSKLNISGACMLRGNQHSDTTLVVDHAVPHCESRELFKCVLDDRARGVFQGKIIVRPDAQKTDGEQMSHALLLSEEAEFDSKPELEIFADDVICGHGATSGQIDEDLLFYLRSRGLPENEARALLVTAFIGESLEVLENESIREAFTDIANSRLASQ